MTVDQHGIRPSNPPSLLRRDVSADSSLPNENPYRTTIPLVSSEIDAPSLDPNFRSIEDPSMVALDSAQIELIYASSHALVVRRAILLDACCVFFHYCLQLFMVIICSFSNFCDVRIAFANSLKWELIQT